MSRANYYNTARQITAAGATLTTGQFVGFQNGGTAQIVTFAAPSLMYSDGALNAGGLTFFAAANAFLPLNCTHLKPSTHPIIGYIV